jgi:hypothetical protein
VSFFVEELDGGDVIVSAALFVVSVLVTAAFVINREL